MNKEKRHEAYTKRRPEAIRKAREWQIDNPGKVRQYKWQFRQDKPMVHRYYNLKSKNKGKIKMTANEFNSWYESEPKQCFYCDIPLDLLSLNNHYTNHRDSHNLFTIDRKECGGDYSLENIVLACPLCNLIKSNFFSADTMRELAQRYVKPRWQQQAGIEPEALFPDKETVLNIERGAIKRNRSWLANVRGWRNPEQIEELIEEATREERKAQGEWLLDEYDRTPLGKRIGLLETVIGKLVDGQALEGD